MCLSNTHVCFFFKQKTAYDMRISDWSSDVCSSDLLGGLAQARRFGEHGFQKLQRNDFATFVDHRVDARHADVLEHGEVLDIGLAKGHPETDAPDFGQVEIGRASCRERVCQYVYISVVAVVFKKKINREIYIT